MPKAMLFHVWSFAFKKEKLSFYSEFGTELNKFGTELRQFGTEFKTVSYLLCCFLLHLSTCGSILLAVL